MPFRYSHLTLAAREHTNRATRMVDAAFGIVATVISGCAAKRGFDSVVAREALDAALFTSLTAFAAGHALGYFREAVRRAPQPTAGSASANTAAPD
jgi:hypothetical protein